MLILNDISKRNQLILEWFKKAINYLKKIEDESIEINSKDHWNNLVTNVDKYIEEKFVENIRQAFPGENIVSEEGFGDGETKNKGVNWFIDPIDGTTNFITMRKHYAIMLAVYEDGVGQLGYIYNRDEDAIYMAIKDEGIYKDNQKLIFNKKDYELNEGIVGMNSHIVRENGFYDFKMATRNSLGIRSQGSAGLELLDLSLGNQVAFVSTHLAPWDIAPGLIFLNERNIIAQQFNGEVPSLTKSEPIIAAYPTAFSDIKEILSN